MLIPTLLALCAVGPLSLEAARGLADEHSAGIAAGRAQLVAAQAGVDSAGQLANPTLSASVGPDEPTVTAGLEVKLPIFGQRGAAIDSAQAAADVFASALELQRVELHAAVRRALAALWAAREQARLSQEAAALAAQLAALAGERMRTGGAAQLEVEQAEQFRRRALQDLADREAEALAAREELAAQLGLGGDGADALEAAPPLAPALPTLDELVRRALAHPELESLRRQEAAALARASEEKTALRPLPAVSLTAERLSGESALGLRAGIAFDLPILSWNRGRVREQEEGARAAAAQGRAAAQRLGGQLRAARARCAASLSRADVYDRDLVAGAARILAMAQEGYRIGRTALVAVLQAQGELAQAKSHAIEAKVDAQRAAADLEEAVGADL